MSWKYNVFGDESPSRTRVVVMSGAFLLLGLSLYGYWAEFVPSPEWSNAGLIATIVIAVALGILNSWAMFTDRISNPFLDTHWKMALGSLIAPVFFGLIVWLVLIHAVGDLATLVAGKETTVFSKLYKDTERATRACVFRVKGEFSDNAYPAYLCMEKGNYFKADDTFEAQIEGKQSMLGFHVAAISQKVVASNPQELKTSRRVLKEK